MTATIFQALPPVLADLVGRTEKYPVRRLFCIGRNYAAHAREMGKDPERDPPFFFTKWAETVMPSGATIAYPKGTSNFHFETELVVAIGPGAEIFGYAVGLDMTRRDLQNTAKEKSWPWDVAKNVEQSAPLGAITLAAAAGDIRNAAIALDVNGRPRQRANISELIWSVPELMAEISRFYQLMPGDLIYTGTPAGVGAVVPGDKLSASITGLAPLEITIGPAA